ncbi:J domain-containing protein [Natrialbaceae archaeon GCM10025810]|uniref:J domain-containing protein n=1 Tax=Halovalidus salilacus TaxID=3075124 RepID=UPI00361DFC5E
MSERLEWPPELERTSADERESTSKFDVTLGAAIKDIKREMDRLEVDHWRLSTAMPQRKTDGLPYASAAEPDDPGAVLRWAMGGDQFAIGCDAYTRVRDNVRAIGLYVAEKRRMEKRPVTTGQSEFATARLPPADDGAVVAEVPPHEVLEIAPDAAPEVIRAAARAKKKETHPDRGGSRAAFQRVVAAEEAMRDD